MVISNLATVTHGGTIVIPSQPFETAGSTIEGGAADGPIGRPGATTMSESLHTQLTKRRPLRWWGVLLLLLPIVGLAAIPRLGFGCRGRRGANESAALATLASLAVGQRRFQQAGYLDTDADGQGEYGSFCQLVGGDQALLTKPMPQPLLIREFTRTAATGLLLRSGYFFRIFVPEVADEAEENFTAIAWPASYGNSGKRCFYIDERGQAHAASNEVWQFSGFKKPLTIDIVGNPRFHPVH